MLYTQRNQTDPKCPKGINAVITECGCGVYLGGVRHWAAVALAELDSDAAASQVDHLGKALEVQMEP
eukprot:5003007-Amphidinium_carterae.1